MSIWRRTGVWAYLFPRLGLAVGVIHYVVPCVAKPIKFSRIATRKGHDWDRRHGIPVFW